MAVAVWQVQPTQLATAQVETMEEIRLEEKERIINLVGVHFSQHKHQARVQTGTELMQTT